jgi:NDP-sugar pyrophosphorylase family protein
VTAVRPLPPLFATLPPPFDRWFDAERPWALLDEALDEALGELPSSRLDGLVDPRAILLGDRIVIEKGARIAPGATLEGPLFVGAGSEVRPGAYLRGGCWVGRDCVIGASTESKRGIFLDRAKAPHLAYVGDSILGCDVNLGAGVICSNFRHDGREIVLRHHDEFLRTGRRKLGAILGDDVAVGCNSVLNPGTIVGAATQIYTGVQLRSGVYPAGSMIKLRQSIEVVPRGEE